MKCPKCGYLGFEHVERCRNCGYNFALTQASNLPELTIRSARADSPDPLADLAFLDAALNPAAPTAPPAVGGQPPSGAVTISGDELPLFEVSTADDIPLITRPSLPRTPLAVRRATPETPRLRSDARAVSPLFQLTPADLEGPPVESVLHPSWQARRAEHTASGTPATPNAGVPRRIVAAAIDVALLAAIDAIVIYFTMKICGLTSDELNLIPKVPLATFLTAQNFGYLVAFTTGGHTLGQMAMGLKVVSSDRAATPDLRNATIRTLVWVALAIPAGLGLLTALLSADRRGLHERFSHTRVVRSGA